MAEHAEDTSAIRDVSDTALWVALYRAQESERKDALFHDPYARRLAGERGQRILDTVPKAQSISWPMVVRTQVLDEIILRLVRDQGVDTVLNLAAGLDARPWRLPLPQATHWIDVDMPAMLEHKLKGMENESTVCRYTARAADLREPGALRGVLDEVGRAAKQMLVVAEGLLIYLEPSDVAALARELANHPACRYWLIDLASPMLLKWMEKRWKGPRGLQNAPFKFAPAEGTAFFEPHGWHEVEYRSTMVEAKRLNRLPPFSWVWAIFALFASKKQKEQWKRFSGQVLMERSSA
jgi:methyltransferase (TIGR00027 family)